jgi:hypothetical protein
MTELTDPQRKILSSLIQIQKHNRNKNNIRAVLQISKHAAQDLQALEAQRFIRFTLMREYQITAEGERAYAATVQSQSSLGAK